VLGQEQGQEQGQGQGQGEQEQLIFDETNNRTYTTNRTY